MLILVIIILPNDFQVIIKLSPPTCVIYRTNMHWTHSIRSSAFHSAFRNTIAILNTSTRTIRNFPTRILVRNQAFLHKCRTKVYHVQKEWMLGIELRPSEVKSLRDHTGDLSNSFGAFYKNELFLHECNIPIWRHGLIGRPEPLRPRKLLARRSELKKLQDFTRETRAELVGSIPLILSL